MKRIAALLLLLAFSANALAVSPFKISDIRVEGLQRIAAGTVYSYMPLKKGDTVDDASAQRAIRALYRTGFFSNIELDRDGDILVVKVDERPTIATLSIRGNEKIKTKDLKKGLNNIGLSEGSTFDKLALDRVKKELVSQYYNRGKYNVSVDPHITHLSENRVNIDIEIHEGKSTRIKGINIVGNQAFSDEEIRDDWESSTTNWLSWYTDDDQYSREKVSGDLEKLGDYYLNRGYADFNVSSTQVTVTPDKRKMYLSASVDEGDVYTIGDVKLVGDMVLPEKTLRQFVRVDKGDTFNRQRLQNSADAMKAVLANIGYAFAEVDPLPDVDKDNDTVDITFYIKPGKRVYVRRINFSGNTRTEGEVLRREMRQLEGSWYSQAAIDRSKTRIKQLGYFKDVKIEHNKVPGTDDKVDLSVSVKEQQAGSLQFGLGYSQYAGAIISAKVRQENFLGTGDKFAVGAQTSKYRTNINFQYTNPYITDTGVSLGYNLRYSKTDYGNTNFANYQNSTRAFSTFLGIPISETDRLQAGLGIESNRINLFPTVSPASYVNYQKALGNRTAHTWSFNATYTHETRNAYWAPTRGGIQQLSLDMALPGSTVQYYKAHYRGNHYWPVGGGFVLYLNGEVGYGGTYGSNTYDRSFGSYKAGDSIDFPFWQNYYAGGARDIRGFQTNTLGPRENSGYYGYPTPIGGSFKVLGNAELYLPLPFLKDIRTARVSVFTDVGNVYRDFSSFDADKLRVSYGISLQWQAPVGPLRISYAIPAREQPGDQHYEERFQFTFGTNF